MATTLTTTAKSNQSSIKAVLNYYDRAAGPMDVLNFTIPGAESKFEKYSKRVEAVPVTIFNIRDLEDKYTLDKNGFQYVEDKVRGLETCTTEDEIKDVLLPATEELVKRLTGAHKTKVFTHRIRSLAEDPAKRADNRAPAHSVHTDFTPAGAMNQLRTVIGNTAELTELEAGRVLIVNVWRPLKAIKRDPLAVLNWQSVSEGDIIPNRMVMRENFWAELGKVKYAEKHEWLYLEGQMPNEALVFKQFDSKAEGGMIVPHSAFADDRWAGEEARQSIEIKMFAFVKE